MQEELIHNNVNFKLSSQLNKHPHNVINFRTERKSKLKSKRQQTNLHDLSLKNASDSFNNMQLMGSLPLRNNNFHKRTTEGNDKQHKLNSGRASVSSQRNKSADRIRSLQLINVPTGFNVRLKNKYKQIEKEIHKGKNNLNIKSVEKWLNDLLIQNCSNEVFQSNLQNPALKRFQLDRNSLISKGVNQFDIDRIYRSLFVYSLGFNKLLQQICKSTTTQNLRRTVWKVYSILLQYCAKGDFQTMIGQIQRDKVVKVQSLRQQIVKCHKVIETVEQSVKQQKFKLYKDMKMFKDANETLLSEINIIENDFKKAEIAFNQQVSLRLRFQHKINQIYGVYQQLSIKHKNLYQDYHTLLNQHHQQKITLQKQIQKKQETIIRTIQLQNIINQKNTQISNKQKQIQRIQSKLKITQLKLGSFQTHKATEILNARNQLRQNKMLVFELNNIKQVLSLKQKSMEQLQRRSIILVGQNQKLFQRIQQQNIRILELNKSQHQFEIHNLNIKSILQLNTEKLKILQVQITKKQALIQENNKTIQQLQIEGKSLQNSIEMLNSNIQIYIKNIEIMKKCKNDIEDELFGIKDKYQKLVEIVDGRQSNDAKITKQLNQAQQQIIIVKQQLHVAQRTLTIKQQDFKHESLKNKRIIQKLLSQKQTLRQKKQQFQNQAILLKIQYQQSQQKQEKLRKMFSDLQFLSNNCELQLKQSLMMIDDTNNYVKDLNITISHLQQAKIDLMDKIVSLKTELQMSEKSKEKQKIKFQKIIQEKTNQINRKIDWIHPMRYHDLEGRCLNQQSIIKEKNTKIQDRQNHISKMAQLKKQQIYKLKIQNINKIETVEKQLNKKLQQKSQQIQQLKMKLNKSENEVNKKIKNIAQLTIQINKLTQNNQIQGQKIYKLQSKIRSLEEQLALLNKLFQQKSGSLKGNQQIMKHKLIECQVQINKYQKRIEILQNKIKQMQRKASLQSNIIDTSNQAQIKCKTQGKQEGHDIVQQNVLNQQNNKTQQQAQTNQITTFAFPLNQRSQTQESHRDVILQPKHPQHISQKPKIQPKSFKKINVTPSSSNDKKNNVMSRKEVVNKMYGAYNYYSKK